MERQKELIFHYLYYGYLGASLLFAIISVILLVKLFVFTLTITTIADIFLVLVMMLASFYFRFNAFHYQKLLINRGE